MKERHFYTFYSWLFFTAVIPYLGFLLPFLPVSLFGFNLVGWAWIIMLAAGLYFFSIQLSSVRFPILFWLPWALYLIGYIVVQYSFFGLQLTLQYLLPLLIGVVASGFTYNREKYRWLFKMLMRLSLFVLFLFAIGRVFRGGLTPYTAGTPMLLSIPAALCAGIFFLSAHVEFLVLFGAFFLVPILDMTRTGIAVFLMIPVLHLANRNILSKIIVGIAVFFVLAGIVNSQSFQEKSRYESAKKLELSDISENLNYYENKNIRSSGRMTFYDLLKPGLAEKPVFGNGPRADGLVLGKILNMERLGESHNDYLSVMYNYGYAGLSLLLFGFAATFLSMLSVLLRESDRYRILLITSTMTLLIGFLMFMYTDNILKYTVIFPDLFFAMAGMVYARYEQEE